MTDTSTTTHDTVAKTATFGMYAVAQHMLDHRLPAPFSIDAPSRCPDEDHGTRRVRVTIPSSALTEWLDSVLVTDQRSRPIERIATSGKWTREEYDVLIPTPIGDVAATIARVHRSQLSLVTSDGVA